MKRLFIIIVSSLMFFDSISIERVTEAKQPLYSISAVNAKEDYSDRQNDLVYHDYGTGIKLTDHSTLIIPQLNLNLEDESASIYVINLENNEIFKLCDYQPLQKISYSPCSEGVYKIVAVISNGEVEDLTPKAAIETDFSGDNGSGFILLN